MSGEYRVGQLVYIVLNSKGRVAKARILGSRLDAVSKSLVYTVMWNNTIIRGVVAKYIRPTPTPKLDFTPADLNFESLIWAINRGIMPPLEL